ncbi:organic cation/carnitine transporter 4-like [Zingiber officinale]|uniref:organic cation/carnitine transporter 4-like n=1 Tax=Zingiber officinale TaxID=94328 RepID=UPI001C4A89A9|nr:organic cation/carnitine transporter 4-like [Zingiber officinale]
MGSLGGATSDLRSPLLLPSERRLGIDEVLRQHAGEFGRWQLRHFVLVSAAWALEAFHTMVMIFADRETSEEPRQWDWLGGGAASTVAEWGLVGEQRYKIGLVQSAFFLGCMIGSGVFGHLSDSFLGRKGSLIVVCILNAIFGFLTSISPAYWFYLALRFLTGFSTGGVGLCAFVLATEPIGPSKRGVAGMSTFYFFSAGIALLAAIAYLFDSWRLLYVVTSLPSLLFVLMILPFVSESPRWYLVRRKTPEAMAVMHSIAKKNGEHIPPGVVVVLDGEHEEHKEDNQVAEIKNNGNVAVAAASIIDVVRSPTTRVRLVLMVAINFLSSVVYYGLNLNVVNLETNIYLSVLLNAVAEMPAYLLTAVLLDRFGRRPLAIGTLWLSGVFCVMGSLASGVAAMKEVRMACGVIGIFGMAATYNLLFIYTAELFPTVVRNAALGCASQASQMGAIAAPLVVVLGGPLPFAVFGLCGMVGGFLAFLLPETMNRPLYDTMARLEEGERY